MMTPATAMAQRLACGWEDGVGIEMRFGFSTQCWRSFIGLRRCPASGRVRYHLGRKHEFSIPGKAELAEEIVGQWFIAIIKRSGDCAASQSIRSTYDDTKISSSQYPAGHQAGTKRSGSKRTGIRG